MNLSDSQNARLNVLKFHGEIKTDNEQRLSSAQELVAAEEMMGGFYSLLETNPGIREMEDDIMRVVSGVCVKAVFVGTISQATLRRNFGLDVTGEDIDLYREELAETVGSVPPGVGV